MTVSELQNNGSGSFLPRVLCGPAEGCQLSGRGALLVAAFSATMLLAFLGTGRSLTYHEVVFAQPAQEMLDHQRWLVPTIAGEPFTDKPPLTAWSIAASMALAGSRSEFVARLPSALATVCVALAVAWLAGRWFGNRVGTVAGLVQASMLYSLTQGRLAEADMLLCLTVLLAMGAFAVAHVESPHGRLRGRGPRLLFHLALGLSYLTKGLVGPTFVIGGCLAWLLLNRDLRGWRWFVDPLGLLISGLLVVPWTVAAWCAWPPMLDNMLLHHVGRFRGELGSHEPFAAYLWLVPMVTLPWTPFAALALWQSWRQGAWYHPLWQFSACWIVPGLLLLSLSAFKARHYPIPLLPPLSILAAVGLLEHLRRQHLGSLRWQPWAAVGCVACSATAIAIVQRRGAPDATAVSVLVVLLGAGLLAAIYCECRRWFRAELVTVFGLVWLVAVGVHAWVIPYHDSYGHQTELAARINERVPENAMLCLVGLPENQITYYLRPELVRYDDPIEFERAPPAEQPLYVVAPYRVAEQLAEAGEVRTLDSAARLNRYMTERDRLTLLRWEPQTERICRMPRRPAVAQSN